MRPKCLLVKDLLLLNTKGEVLRSDCIVKEIPRVNSKIPNT